jgi:hypothetical protein
MRLSEKQAQVTCFIAAKLRKSGFCKMRDTCIRGKKILSTKDSRNFVFKKLKIMSVSNNAWSKQHTYNFRI